MRGQEALGKSERAGKYAKLIAFVIVAILLLTLFSLIFWKGTQFNPTELLTQTMESLVSWMMTALYSQALQMSTIGG